MVDLMNLLSDVLIGGFQMLMLNDLGKNMFSYRIKTYWTRILIYGVTALVILGVNHIESTFINIMRERCKLKKADYQKNELSDEYQRRLILIWEKILRISIEDSNKTFFELGGDSLGMVRMVNEINENFQISITIVDIVEHSSIQELVEFLVNNIEEGMI